MRTTDANYCVDDGGEYMTMMMITNDYDHDDDIMMMIMICVLLLGLTSPEDITTT